VTVVVGTAGHIDHGKTALLRALTGMDADRLPEERRRGMTLDVGYAHMTLPDGSELDFVDVPGHDRLVGNMLVGAGEIDAVMLAVAADDGPRAQTLEHLELLDALGLRHGIAVVTKVDLVDPARVAVVRDAMSQLLGGTSLAGSPILEVSALDGRGMPALVAALADLCVRAAGDPVARRADRPTLAVDRAFSVKGRGLVVTGTLRGGSLNRNETLWLVPAGRVVRARELQVHGRPVDRAAGGRTAVNLVGVDAADVHRGDVVTADRSIVATDRVLVRLARPMPDRTRVRLHLGTVAVDAAVGRSGRDALDIGAAGVGAILRLAAPIAAAPGDRFVLRRLAGAERIVGGTVLDVAPPRGVSRRRQHGERVARLATAIRAGDTAEAGRARLDLHGALVETDRRALLADDVRTSAAEVLLHELAGEPDDRSDPGPELDRPRLADVRMRAARILRRLVTLRRDEAPAGATELVDHLLAEGRLVRDGDRVHRPGAAPPASAEPDPALAAAMARLEASLATPAPPALTDAARTAGCSPAGIRELERAGRIVVLEPELAYAAPTYRTLGARALAMASHRPLTPAALRDATGTSRKYVMAILADLDRRGVLRRTDAGHVPGPRAGVAGAGTAPGDSTADPP
jgi:selenocysteine-specific elongation factor